MEEVRAASPEDLATLAALARELRAELRALRGGVLWDAREAGPEPLEAGFAALLARDDACVVVGTIDGAPVGYGFTVIEQLRDGSRLGVIPELYVEPDARAVGVGESVAAALIRFCEDAGCVGIDATALPGHREAKNFFERNGFTARALTMHRRIDSKE